MPVQVTITLQWYHGLRYVWCTGKSVYFGCGIPLAVVPYVKQYSILEIPGYSNYHLSLTAKKYQDIYSHFLNLDPKRSKLGKTLVYERIDLFS